MGNQVISLQQLLGNPVFQSGFFSLVLAQMAKAIVLLLKRRKLEAKEIAFVLLWKTGGMPSSHTALAVSLTVSIALTEGFDSLFVLSFFVALIVIRDALGVRRSSGLQARALNRLGQDIMKKLAIDYQPVKEIHGHSWEEVLAGAVLGLLVALFMCRNSMLHVALLLPNAGTVAYCHFHA
ncbi:MAG: divergent PAP2 family protein [Spirochaetaceae bacterium]|nr:divergent PAP2 family protein [Spirochaetaceae bacterium]